jgi:signal transduction histidine kinase
MTEPGSLVELGERYWALGLPAAARSAFARALASAPAADANAARRLAEIALAVGDPAGARRYAAEVVRREPGAASRVLLGQAQLAAGEIGAARLSFAAALDGAATPGLRARAHLGLSQASGVHGDPGGAAAHVAAALGELAVALSRTDAAPAELDELADAEVGLAEELFATTIALGRGSDAAATLADAAARRPDGPLGFYRALLGAARLAQGDRGAPEMAEAEVDAALRTEADRRPGSRVVRLRVIERQLRRRYQDAAARAGAIGELERMAAELADDPQHGSSVERARVWFLLAAAYEDDPAAAVRAEDAYRRGLTLRPGHAVAACRLALLMLDRGDTEGALAEIERALRIDAGFGLAWRNAARMLDAAVTASGEALGDVVARLLDAAYPGAGSAASVVAPRLLAATAELARGDVLAGVHAHGHRVKNVLGIIGSRTRSARKLAGDGGELSDRLRDLEREVTALYEEWAQYLRSMQAAGPTLEVVAVAPLIHDVAASAGAKSQGPIEVHLASGLPDLRGDRMLLREALLNLVSNAVEACAAGGQVTITARPVQAGGAAAVEVVVGDTGPGIPRGELGRIFVPGYTTKETGSGVGLAIAERVVMAHHGRILVDSDEGKGTQVTVILPTDLGGFATLRQLSPHGEAGAV